uniref:Uncharacterized protein n=1 Tax=Anguilla anguilla TaxID=7936 RepID=A0A0E9VID9_ANGAN
MLRNNQLFNNLVLQIFSCPSGAPPLKKGKPYQYVFYFNGLKSENENKMKNRNLYEVRGNYVDRIG